MADSFPRYGVDIAPSGTHDEDLIPILHQLPSPTFFTLDRDFYRRELAHRNYCLVWLNLPRRDAADYCRRVLRHAAFDTQAKRLGKVIRVHDLGLHFWEIGRRASKTVRWLY